MLEENVGGFGLVPDYLDDPFPRAPAQSMAEHSAAAVAVAELRKDDAMMARQRWIWMAERYGLSMLKPFKYVCI